MIALKRICLMSVLIASVACLETENDEGPDKPTEEKTTYVQSDVAGTWFFTGYDDFEATYDETGERISESTVQFVCPPTRFALKADGTLSGKCIETGSGMVSWTLSYTYTGTMSGDKTSMSGSLERYQFWSTGDNQTEYFDWSANKISDLQTESDTDSGSDGDTAGDI